MDSFVNMEHAALAGGRWAQMSLVEQLANVGSEVERAIRWREKNDPEHALRAAERALELMDLSLDSTEPSAGFARFKELARAREALVDFFFGPNLFGSTHESWKKYFLYFSYAARKNT
jgi:hypothetical protein